MTRAFFHGLLRLLQKSNKKDKWAISLDILAPQIVIPGNWPSPNGGVVVFNLGHFTFENFAKGEFESMMRTTSNAPGGAKANFGGRSMHKIEEHEYVSDDDESDDDDDDEFVTPPNTPPNFEHE